MDGGAKRKEGLAMSCWNINGSKFATKDVRRRYAGCIFSKRFLNEDPTIVCPILDVPFSVSDVFRVQATLRE